MKKHTPYTPLASLLLLAYTAVAALAQTPLQLRWQAAANDPQPWRGLVFRGESVGLNPSLTLYGRALALPTEATATLYWQTPGMEGAWWTAPATCTTNGQLSATWTPEMDNGSPLYTFYIGVQHPDDTRTYRAYGQLRMQNAPGAVPNEIDLPPRTLDFATVLVTNAPWATPDDITTAISEIDVEEHDLIALGQLAAHKLADNPHAITPASIGAVRIESAFITNSLTIISPSNQFRAFLYPDALKIVANYTNVLTTARFDVLGVFTDEVGGSSRHYAWPSRSSGTFATEEYADTKASAAVSAHNTSASAHATLFAGLASESWVQSINWRAADVATNLAYTVVVSNGHWLIISQEVQ